MTEIWNKRKWDEGELNDHFRSECHQWIMLFLKTIDITDPNASQMLKIFLAPKSGSIVAKKDIQSAIVNVILKNTRESFSNLTIELFLPLFSEHRIWPIPVSRTHCLKYSNLKSS